MTPTTTPSSSPPLAYHAFSHSVHPFLMGNAQAKVVQVVDADEVPICSTSRRQAPPRPSASASTWREPPLPPPSPLPRAASATPVANPPRPPLGHGRAMSDTASPRRALGLVRKLSFRSKPSATVTPRQTSANSADDAEVLKKDAAGDPPRVVLADLPPRSASSLSRSSPAPMTTPSRPPRRVQSPDSKSSADEPQTPTRATPRAVMPRSPPRWSKRSPTSSPHKSPPHRSSPHRGSMSAGRRAEKEWKAKVAALALPQLPKETRPVLRGSGPRPPPRRLPKTSLGGLTASASMSQLSQFSEPIVAPKRSIDSAPKASSPEATRTPDFVRAPPRSSSAHALSSLAGPGVASATLAGLPEYGRTPLSPIAQEPLSPLPPTPASLTPVTLTPRSIPLNIPIPPIPQSSPSVSGYAPSLAPTFGPAPSPQTTARALDSWTPDDRVVVARASVPELARVTVTASPPDTPAPVQQRLKDKPSPAPAPTCTPPSHRATPPAVDIAPPEAGLKLQSAMYATPAPAERMMKEAEMRDHSTFGLTRTPRPKRTRTPPQAMMMLPPMQPPSPPTDFGLGMETDGKPLVPRTSSLPRSTSLATGLGADVIHDERRPQLRSAYNLTPGLEGGRRPRKTGLPVDDLQRWLAQTSI